MNMEHGFSLCKSQKPLDTARRNSSRLLWRTAHDLSFLSSIALERVQCSLPSMALKMFFVRLLPMPCTMGLCYSFLVTHKRAVYYTFSPDLEWVSFSGPVVTVGWCGDILLSYYSFLFPLLLCYPFTWSTLALSVEVSFPPRLVMA